VSTGDEKQVVTRDPKSSPAGRTVTRGAGDSWHAMRSAPDAPSRCTAVTISVGR